MLMIYRAVPNTQKSISLAKIYNIYVYEHASIYLTAKVHNNVQQVAADVIAILLEVETLTMNHSKDVLVYDNMKKCVFHRLV